MRKWFFVTKIYSYWEHECKWGICMESYIKKNNTSIMQKVGIDNKKKYNWAYHPLIENMWKNTLSVPPKRAKSYKLVLRLLLRQILKYLWGMWTDGQFTEYVDQWTKWYSWWCVKAKCIICMSCLVSSELSGIAILNCNNSMITYLDISETLNLLFSFPEGIIFFGDLHIFEEPNDFQTVGWSF